MSFGKAVKQGRMSGVRKLKVRVGANCYRAWGTKEVSCKTGSGFRRNGGGALSNFLDRTIPRDTAILLTQRYVRDRYILTISQRAVRIYADKIFPGMSITIQRKVACMMPWLPRLQAQAALSGHRHESD